MKKYNPQTHHRRSSGKGDTIIRRRVCILLPFVARIERVYLEMWSTVSDYIINNPAKWNGDKFFLK